MTFNWYLCVKQDFFDSLGEWAKDTTEVTSTGNYSCINLAYEIVTTKVLYSLCHFYNHSPNNKGYSK